MMPFPVTKTPAKQKRICMVAYTHYGSDPGCRREAGDASDLARCIIKLYKEPELRHSLSRNASKFLEAHSWDKEKEKLFSLVESL